MTEFKIEKNIPMPRPFSPRAKYPFSNMEIGDSFKCEAKTALAAYSHSKRHGGKFTTRKHPDGTYRCWRIE